MRLDDDVVTTSDPGDAGRAATEELRLGGSAKIEGCDPPSR
jgi:hypothetical protein